MTEPINAPGPRRQFVFAITAFGAFMASLDLSIVNVAFPSLEASFPADPRSTLAWVITAYSILFGSLLVTAGRGADRYGRRRVFLGGLLVFILGSFLCGIAPTVPLLVVGRIIQAVGAAAMLPASVGLLLMAYPSERRSQIVAIWGGIGALAVATGPSLGAALITIGGWRWAFFVNVPIGLLAIFLGLKVLPKSAGTPTGIAPDYLGVATITIAISALVLGISQGPQWRWLSWPEAGCAALTIGAGALFYRRASTYAEPVLDLKLFSARTFRYANLATMLYAMGFFAMLLGNILFLTSVWHYTILRAGLAITPGPIVVASISWASGRLAARWGFRIVLVIGSIVLASGLLWYATMLGPRPEFLTRWLPGAIIAGVGIGMTFPVLAAAAVSSLKSDRFAVGSAVNQTARQIGGAIGIAVLVVILGNAKSPADALANFRHLWIYTTLAIVASGISSLAVKDAAAPRAESVAQLRH